MRVWAGMEGSGPAPPAPTNLRVPVGGTAAGGGLSRERAGEGHRAAGCRTGSSLESSQHIKPLMGLMISGAPRGKLD